MASEKNPYDRNTIGSSEELDEYGVWVKSEPQDLSLVNTDTLETGGPEDDFSPELTGDLSDFNPSEPEPPQTGVSADMTEPADFNLTSAGGSGSLDDLNWFDGGLAFTPGGKAEESALPEPEVPDEEAEEQAPIIEAADAFEDNDLFGIPMDDFLLEPEPENEIPGPSLKLEEPGSSGDLSTQLLMKIAEELSSIKNELFGLKKELHLKSGAAAEPAEQSGSGGGFGEEEGETIALTGDEPGEIFFPDADAPGEDILDLSVENAEVSPELEQLRETGVEPMTPAPEDVSILEDDPAAADLAFSDLSEDDPFNSSFDTSSFDPSFDFDDAEAVIEEPDLNGELQENPIEEPSLEEPPLGELSEELSFEEPSIEEPSLEEPSMEEPSEEPSLDESSIGELSPEDLSLELDMEIPPAEDIAADLPDDGGDGGDDSAIEEIELSLGDSGGSDGLCPDELSGEFSLDDALLDTAADISLDDIDDIIDIPPEDETEAAGEAPDDDIYDRVIPEGFSEDFPENFLGESEDSPVPEEILENADDPFTLDDILDAEDIPEGLSIRPEAAGEDEGTAEAESDAEPAEVADEEPAAVPAADGISAIPSGIRNELRSVLSYMDQLLESLPEDKIEEFAKSEHFDAYKKLFGDLGLV